MRKSYWVLLLTICYSLTSTANSQFYSEVLPPLMCSNSTYFRECFSIPQNKCLLELKKASDDCITQLYDELSALKKNKDLSTEKIKNSARIKIGSCMGDIYEKRMSAHKKSDSKCLSEKGW